MAERLRVREIDDDEGRRLVRIVRRRSRSVVTWRRAQMVLLSAQGMDAAGIARVTFTSKDRVRDVIRNFSADGFASLYPKYRGGQAFEAQGAANAQRTLDTSVWEPDPEQPGYSRRARSKTVAEVFAEIVSETPVGAEEYLKIGAMVPPDLPWPDQNKRTVVYAVTSAV